MALKVNPMDSRLQIQFDYGVNSKGKKVTHTKTFNKVKSSAADQDLFDFAQAVAGLTKDTVLSVKKVTTSSMINE